MDRRVAVVVALSLGSCAMSSAPSAPANPATQAQFARLLAGRVPGRPMSCIPSYPSAQTEVISADTIAIRQGSMVYLSQFRGTCNQAGSPGYALVFRNVGMSGPCQNDVVEVKDLAGGFSAGSCALGPFVPYNLAR